MRTGILQGLRVLELGRMISGQHCTMHLADHGAEVIRIDATLKDGNKDNDPEPDLAAPSDGLTRGKKHIRLDLQSGTGKQTFVNLAAGADVIVETFRPDVMARLGLSYETLAAINPKLVYAANRGLGDPRSDGGDIIAGLSMAFGIMTALREAEATGHGQCVDVAMNENVTDTGPARAGHDHALRSGTHGHGAQAAPPAPEVDDALLETLVAPQDMDPEAKRALRNAFGSFATGVTVVTTRQPDGAPRGFTANSFTSVSLDPPLLLVCIGKTAHSCDSFVQADHFAINILADDQKEISGLFASQSSEKFEHCKWQNDPQNMPLIDGALARFSCRQHRLVDAGDHLILIGRVLDFETSDGAPLGYYKGAYFDIGLEEDLADAAASNARVSLGAVLTSDGHVLLGEDASGRISVPTAPADTNSVGGLATHLQRLGLTATLDHLYAVYQNTHNRTRRIIYHGNVAGMAPSGMRYFALDGLPLDRVTDDAERSMLRRFIEENQHGAFGIYHGTDVRGVVHAIAGHHSYHI